VPVLDVARLLWWQTAVIILINLNSVFTADSLRYAVILSSEHRRCHDFHCGGALFPPKIDDLFSHHPQYTG